jgi:hypothetical protein
VGRLLPVVLDPPGVPGNLRPVRLTALLAVQGAERRRTAATELRRVVDDVVPWLVQEVLRRVPLTEVVLRNVDLDAVVAAVDLDGAAARLDVDAVVARADLDAAVATVDLDAAVARVDLEEIVRRLDLTELVLTRVDLGRLVDAVLAQVDLVRLAQEVIDAVDLPAIIRESTGSMASDTVRGARMQGIAADEAVGRAMDRLLLRRRGQVPGRPADLPDQPAAGTVPVPRQPGG